MKRVSRAEVHPEPTYRTRISVSGVIANEVLEELAYENLCEPQ